MGTRPGDGDSHYAYVRKTKAALGIVFALTALASVWFGGDKVVILGLALMSGIMLDAPSVTQLVSVVVKAIPWSKNGTPPPSTDERP